MRLHIRLSMRWPLYRVLFAMVQNLPAQQKLHLVWKREFWVIICIKIIRNLKKETAL